MSDPFETYDVLCDSYIRYIQTNLGFNSEELEKGEYCHIDRFMI